MRVLPLAIIGLIVAGAGYMLVFQRDKVNEWFGGAVRTAQGYTPAKTPREAAEKFLQAIKERRYKAAAVYCSGDYAAILKKADAAASTIGNHCDRLLKHLEEKAFTTPKSTYTLHQLDPFPTNIKLIDVKYKEGDKTAIAMYGPDPTVTLNMDPLVGGELERVDTAMFGNVLSPGPALLKVEVKQDDKQNWLLNIPFAQIQHDRVNHFIQHYKAYDTAFDRLNDEVRQGRHLKDQVFPEILNALAASK